MPLGWPQLPPQPPQPPVTPPPAPPSIAHRLSLILPLQEVQAALNSNGVKAVSVETVVEAAEAVSSVIAEVINAAASGATAPFSPPPSASPAYESSNASNPAETTSAEAGPAPPMASDEEMDQLRFAVEKVSAGALLAAEPDAPAVVISTTWVAIVAESRRGLSSEPFLCPTSTGPPIEAIFTATSLEGINLSKPIGAVLWTSEAPLFPTHLSSIDRGRRLLPGDGRAEGSGASLAGASVSFSLYQDGNKLDVEGLESPVQISVPVRSPNDLDRSCIGQPSALALVNDMGAGSPGCLDALECRFWDPEASAWSTEGCTTTRYNKSGAIAIGCECSHLSDFVAVKVPTALRSQLDLALVHVPSGDDSSTALQRYDLAVIPGDKHVALHKDGASAPPTTVTVRLSFEEDEAPQNWRLLSTTCASNAMGCARPALWPGQADAAWNASDDLILRFNASGLAEDPRPEAYVTEVLLEVLTALGSVRRQTVGFAASVTAKAVATASAWGATPPRKRCAMADLGEAAAAGEEGAVVAEVGQRLSLPLSLCDFEGLAVAHGLPSADDARLVTAVLGHLTSANASAAVMGSPVVVQYAGGPLYRVELSLPHLGRFIVTARLGSEQIGTLILDAKCPTGLQPMMDGRSCGCPAGSQGSAGIDAKCTPCEAGTASTTVGGTCSPCGMGSFATDGADQCTACPRGKFSRRVMAAECVACSPGTYSAAGATQCSSCGLRDRRQRTAETQNGDMSSNSPFGIDCADGVLTSGVLPEHWAGAPVNEGNANLTRVWACETQGVCLGGVNSSCREGHTGVLCADCLEGYTRRVERLCEPFSGDSSGAGLLLAIVLLACSMLGCCLALVCCLHARPRIPTPKPPWLADGGGAAPKHAAPPRGEKAYDVWVHREADHLLPFAFGEGLVIDLRKFGIDARVDQRRHSVVVEEEVRPQHRPQGRRHHRPSLFSHLPHLSKRRGSHMPHLPHFHMPHIALHRAHNRSRDHVLKPTGTAQRDGQKKSVDGHKNSISFQEAYGLHRSAKSEEPHAEGTTGDARWTDLRMALKLQRFFRKMQKMPVVPQGELDDAAVCIFNLTDSFFQDQRSVDLLKRAVQLSKPIELIVLPYAKWGPEHDKPFPENVFNPHWEPYLPELGDAFRTIAINWKVEYRPACLLQAVERIAPLLRHKVDPAMAKEKCTAMETEELRRAAAWRPKEVTLEWNWEEKVYDVFLSHKITDAKDIVLSWYNTLSAMAYKPFLDRLTLDKVENIPTYVEQTATFVIAVSTNLFQSYWCAVELCKAVDCHEQGKLNILLVPIEGDTWTMPESEAKIFFPTPEIVLAKFGTW